MTRKGFTLFEMLIASIILVAIGTGMAGIYVAQGALLRNAAHRLEAVNYIQSCADSLMSLGRGVMLENGTGVWLAPNGESMGPPELALGIHNTATDPALCTLPDAYFKQSLNGTLEYLVEKVPFSEAEVERGYLRVKITAKWTENLGGQRTAEETFYIIACEYTYDILMMML